MDSQNQYDKYLWHQHPIYNNYWISLKAMTKWFESLQRNSMYVNNISCRELQKHYSFCTRNENIASQITYNAHDENKSIQYYEKQNTNIIYKSAKFIAGNQRIKRSVKIMSRKTRRFLRFRRRQRALRRKKKQFEGNLLSREQNAKIYQKYECTYLQTEADKTNYETQNLNKSTILKRPDRFHVYKSKHKQYANVNLLRGKQQNTSTKCSCHKFHNVHQEDRNTYPCAKFSSPPNDSQYILGYRCVNPDYFEKCCNFSKFPPKNSSTANSRLKNTSCTCIKNSLSRFSTFKNINRGQYNRRRGVKTCNLYNRGKNSKHCKNMSHTFLYSPFNPHHMQKTHYPHSTREQSYCMVPKKDNLPHYVETASNSCLKSSEASFTEDTVDGLEFTGIGLIEMKKKADEFRKKRDYERQKLGNVEYIDSGDFEKEQKFHIRDSQSNKMQLLYGKDAPTMAAMDNAMTLNLKRFHELRKPNIWPILPIRLSTL